MTDKTILVVGTYDTKNDVLEYMVERICSQGGGVLTMDVSVLGDPENPTDYSKPRLLKQAAAQFRRPSTAAMKTPPCK